MAFDLSGDLFDHLLKNLEADAVTTIYDPSTYWDTLGSFRRFDQQEFVDDGFFEDAGLAKYGYIYYPENCKTQSCKVHMHLHGCLMIHQGLTKDGFKDDGFLQYAATNGIIILFPQAEYQLFGESGNG